MRTLAEYTTMIGFATPVMVWVYNRMVDTFAAADPVLRVLNGG